MQISDWRLQIQERSEGLGLVEFLRYKALPGRYLPVAVIGLPVSPIRHSTFAIRHWDVSTPVCLSAKPGRPRNPAGTGGVGPEPDLQRPASGVWRPAPASRRFFSSGLRGRRSDLGMVKCRIVCKRSRAMVSLSLRAGSCPGTGSEPPILLPAPLRAPLSAADRTPGWGTHGLPWSGV